MIRVNSKTRARKANKGSKPNDWFTNVNPWSTPQPKGRAFVKTRTAYVLEVNLMSVTNLVNRLRTELDNMYEETDFGPLREFESDPYDKSLIGTGRYTKTDMMIKLERKTKKGRDKAKAIIEAMFLAHGLIPAFFQFKEYEETRPEPVW